MKGYDEGNGIVRRGNDNCGGGGCGGVGGGGGGGWVFFFNDTATTEIYTLSLHDALLICEPFRSRRLGVGFV